MLRFSSTVLAAIACAVFVAGNALAAVNDGVVVLKTTLRGLRRSG